MNYYLHLGKFKNVSKYKKIFNFPSSVGHGNLGLRQACLPDRQGWNGLFEPEVALCGSRRVVTACLPQAGPSVRPHLYIKFPIPKVMINNRVEMAICFRKGSSNLGSWIEATFRPLKINSGMVVKNKRWMGE